MDEGEIYRGAFVGADDRIYVTTTAALVAVDETGQITRRLELPGGIDTDSAVASDGTIYTIDIQESVLYALHSGCGGLAESPWPKFQYDSRLTGRRP